MSSVPTTGGAGWSPHFLGDEPAPLLLCPTDDAVREYRRLRRLGLSQVIAATLAAPASWQHHAARMRRLRARQCRQDDTPESRHLT